MSVEKHPILEFDFIRHPVRFVGQDRQAVNSRCLLLCLPKYEKWGQKGQTCVLKKSKER